MSSLDRSPFQIGVSSGFSSEIWPGFFSIESGPSFLISFVKVKLGLLQEHEIKGFHNAQSVSPVDPEMTSPSSAEMTTQLSGWGVAIQLDFFGRLTLGLSIQIWPWAPKPIFGQNTETKTSTPKKLKFRPDPKFWAKHFFFFC